MKKFLHFIFALMLIGGAGIFVIGMLMNFTGIGLDTKFYMFFNDNVWGWIIMFGSILVGIIGLKATGSSDGYYYSSYNHSTSDSKDRCDYDYGDCSSHATDTESDYTPTVEFCRYYDRDSHSVGYRVGDRYYNNEGSCTGYDVGDRHYDSDGNSTGYRVGDREYDSDGHSVGYWVGDTFYED